MANSTRRFEFIGGTSAKFWEVTVDDMIVSAEWGRIGKTSRTKEWYFGGHQEAVSYAKRQMRSKRSKGYIEVAEANEDYEPPPRGQKVNTNFMGSAASDPIGASMGQVYYNTDTDSLRIYVGSGWTDVAGSSSTGDQSKVVPVEVTKGRKKRAFDFSGDAMGGFDDE